MICPQCGYDMGNKNRCLRCGYENTMPAVADETEKEEPKKEKAKSDEPEVIEIDPCNVYLTHPYGYDDDSGTGFGMRGDPFASLFDDFFGDPIGDLLGGLFGFDVRPRRSVRNEEPPKKRKKQGPVIDVDKKDVEILDADNNPIDSDRPRTEQSHRESARHGGERDSDGRRAGKNPFRRRRR